jgi:predicted glutamine amidotransferase
VNNPDGIGFKGRITFDGKKAQEFIHNGDVKAWETLNGTFYRPLNHLNVVKNEYRIQAPFPEINYGEDKAQSDDMTKFIKNYEYINEVMYFYRYVSNK